MAQPKRKLVVEPVRAEEVAEFDKVLQEQHWNIGPRKEIVIPSSLNPLANAAKAIAISAYPQRESLKRGGKAHKYFEALIAYVFRVSQWTGGTKKLPSHVIELKIERMWARLRTGHKNLLRSFAVRDLIASALINKVQHEAARRGQRSAFTMDFSPDLRTTTFTFSIKETDQGTLLVGEIPPDGPDSLRSAINAYRSALASFAGPSPRIEGPDEEAFYQNTLTRFVRPTMQTAHIRQIVWEATNQYREESTERKLPIDQILMRKAVWAADVHLNSEKKAWWAIRNMIELGLSSCSCSLVHIGPPAPDS